jgi:DNA-directed RNA polymerase subunit alpha
VTSEENLEGEHEIGLIPVDSIYTPVRKVKFSIESARVGKKTDYDKLIMEITTNGTIDPKMALIEAAKIMRKHLNPFIQYTDLGEAFHGKQEEALDGEDADYEEESDEDFPEKSSEGSSGELLSQDISSLGLKNRALNGLRNASIHTVEKLLQLTEEDLNNLPKVGKTSIDDIKEALVRSGLSLKQS